MKSLSYQFGAISFPLLHTRAAYRSELSIFDIHFDNLCMMQRHVLSSLQHFFREKNIAFVQNTIQVYIFNQTFGKIITCEQKMKPSLQNKLGMFTTCAGIRLDFGGE